MRIFRVALGLSVVLLGACASDKGDDDSGSTASGVEGECTAGCDRAEAKDCSSHAGSFFDHDTCIAGCTAMVDMKKDTDACYAEATAFYDCTSKLSDICPAFEYSDTTGSAGFTLTAACPTENQDYALCIRNYCLTYPSKSYCM